MYVWSMPKITKSYAKLKLHNMYLIPTVCQRTFNQLIQIMQRLVDSDLS